MGCLGKTGAEKGRLKRSEEEDQEIGKRIIKRYVSFTHSRWPVSKC